MFKKFKNVRWTTLWFVTAVVFCLIAVVSMGIEQSKGGWYFAIPGVLTLLAVLEFFCWGVSESRLYRLLDSTPFKLPRKERWKWFKQQQPEVDRILREKALAFHEQCEREKEAVSDPKADLSKVAETTRSLKNHFWSAHGIFKKFGFKVEGSHKHYLPDSKQDSGAV